MELVELIRSLEEMEGKKRGEMRRKVEERYIHTYRQANVNTDIQTALKQIEMEGGAHWRAGKTDEQDNRSN